MLLTFLAAIIRLLTMQNAGIWFDEAVSLLIAKNNIYHIITGSPGVSVNPPLYYILLHLWSWIAGGEIGARLLSVFFGLAAVIMAYLLALRLMGERIALLTALIFTVSPFQVYYSQELRMYSLLTFLSLGIMHSTIGVLQRDRIIDWIGLVLFSIAGLYTHYFTALVIAVSIGLIIVSTYRQRAIIMKAFIACIIIAALFAPWVPSFMNIKCRYSNMRPNAVVLVATVRALKSHSGDFKIVAGQPLDRGLLEENIDALSRGCANLQKQVRNAALFGVPVVVAINSFPTDTQAEIDMVVEQALSAGAFDAVISNVWSDGGQGGLQLAEAVIRAAETPADFRFLYDLNIPIKEKIEIIATRVYGAEGVDYLPAAEKGIARYTEMGYDRLPVCMAKTHLSLSHDPLLKGCPSGFRLPIKEIRASVGAGFLYPLCGDIRTMPGLPTKPAAEGIDLDDEGRVIGLF
jgi:hypothetical protein